MNDEKVKRAITEIINYIDKNTDSFIRADYIMDIVKARLEGIITGIDLAESSVAPGAATTKPGLVEDARVIVDDGS